MFVPCQVWCIGMFAFGTLSKRIWEYPFTTECTQKVWKIKPHPSPYIKNKLEITSFNNRQTQEMQNVLPYSIFDSSLS
jgi:hypothetical protein